MHGLHGEGWCPAEWGKGVPDPLLAAKNIPHSLSTPIATHVILGLLGNRVQCHCNWLCGISISINFQDQFFIGLLAVAFSLSDSICKVQSVGASQLVISRFKPCLSPDSLTHFLQPANKKTWPRGLSRAPNRRNCSPMFCDNAPRGVLLFIAT